MNWFFWLLSITFVNAETVSVLTSKVFSLSLEDQDDSAFLQALSVDNNTHEFLASEYNKNYEVKLMDEPYSQLQMAVPVTSCHDSTGGSGGDIGVSFTYGLDTSNGISTSLALPILQVISLSSSYSVSRSYSVTSSYTCNIPKGSRGQIWVAPFAILATIQHRSVYSDKQNEIMDSSPWSSSYLVRVPSAISPMISCRTNKYSACTMPVPKILIPLGDIPN